MAGWDTATFRIDKVRAGSRCRGAAAAAAAPAAPAAAAT